MLGTSIAAYAAGFVLATAVLHASGIAAGLAIRRWGRPMAMRVAGGMITAMGLLILCGIIRV